MQGFFSGTYNALAGRVRHNNLDVGEISGKWSQMMEFKNPKVNILLILQVGSFDDSVFTDG